MQSKQELNDALKKFIENGEYLKSMDLFEDDDSGADVNITFKDAMGKDIPLLEKLISLLHFKMLQSNEKNELVCKSPEDGDDTNINYLLELIEIILKKGEKLNTISKVLLSNIFNKDCNLSERNKNLLIELKSIIEPVKPIEDARVIGSGGEGETVKTEGGKRKSRKSRKHRKSRNQKKQSRNRRYKRHSR
jgi:hypothetical protein